MARVQATLYYQPVHNPFLIRAVLGIVYLLSFNLLPVEFVIVKACGCYCHTCRQIKGSDTGDLYQIEDLSKPKM